jgi:hypothetical protein
MYFNANPSMQGRDLRSSVEHPEMRAWCSS